jgi:hypothetical protein
LRIGADSPPHEAARHREGRQPVRRDASLGHTGTSRGRGRLANTSSRYRERRHPPGNPLDAPATPARAPLNAARGDLDRLLARATRRLAKACPGLCARRRRTAADGIEDRTGDGDEPLSPHLRRTPERARPP